MSVAEMLEQLVRIIPGVGGYQDKDASRDTDRSVRFRLANDLAGIKREIENEKIFYMEKKDLSPLPELDRSASKLDKLSNLVKYAPRGYRSFFDTNKHDLKKLEHLYTFDLALFDSTKTFLKDLKNIQDCREDANRFIDSMQQLNKDLDQFEKDFSKRQDILSI